MVRMVLRFFMVSVLLFWSALPVFAASVPLSPEGYVSDYAHLLTNKQADKITTYLRQLQERTGDQMVVATFDTLGDQPLEAFSIKLAEQWKIGQAGKDNGVILLVVKKDRRVRFEVGYGLEGVLTDALTADTIQKTMLPNFKRGFDASAIWDGVTRIGSVLEVQAGYVKKFKAKTIAEKGNQQVAKTVAVKKTNTQEHAGLYFLLLLLAIALFYLGIAYIIISVVGNTILSFKHFFSQSKVTHSNRWFGPHAFFRVTLAQALFFYLLFSGGGSKSIGRRVVGGGGTFGGGGASGAW